MSLEKQTFEREVAAVETFQKSHRFEKIVRPYSAADVVSKRGTLSIQYPSDIQAQKLFKLLESKARGEGGGCTATYGALDPVQLTQMAKHLETVYVSGWQCSSTASSSLEPGPDLAGLTAVMKLTKMMVESGAAGIHIEDQAPGTKKCGHMAGKTDIMGTTNLLVCRTDSEAATLITTNIDPRDHAFILGSTNPDLLPLNDLMFAAEAEGKYGDALGQIEEEWTRKAGLKLYPDTLVDALRSQGVSKSRVDEFIYHVHSASLSKSALLQLAKSVGLKSEPYWSWDTARSREGYYRYQGGTHCAINRAVAFAPYCDLLWMETKSPIYAQAKEFAQGVHKVYPGKWLAYNLSPSFNWEKAGLGKKEMKEYIWELGKLGFVFQFITLAGLHSNAYINDLFAKTFATEGMKAYVELIQSREREIGCDVLTHQKWSGAEYADAMMMTVTGGVSSTAAMGKGVTEAQFVDDKTKDALHKL
ncbi:isocitrate lyase [Cryptococcus depauperatus CBS 7841]|uniref:Isocitrate lyase n=1 Tax=Cryptococcus depauperatus CBS 7841 TaxID=1295531 RepID=A0AAJ8JPC4_9TREE